jgi:hypothetical protein
MLMDEPECYHPLETKIPKDAVAEICRIWRDSAKYCTSNRGWSEERNPIGVVCMDPGSLIGAFKLSAQAIARTLIGLKPLAALVRHVPRARPPMSINLKPTVWEWSSSDHHTAIDCTHILNPAPVKEMEF